MGPRYPQDHRTPAPDLPCGEHDLRLTRVEDEVKSHGARLMQAERDLGDGRVQFAELRKDIQGVTRAVENLANEAKSAAGSSAQAISTMVSSIQEIRPRLADKLIDACVAAIVPSILFLIVWGLASSGAVKPGIQAQQTNQSP